MNVWTVIGSVMLGCTAAPGLEHPWILALAGGACIYTGAVDVWKEKLRRVNTALAMYEDVVDAAMTEGLARATGFHEAEDNRVAWELLQTVNPVVAAQKEITLVVQADRTNMLPSYTKTKRDN